MEIYLAAGPFAIFGDEVMEWVRWLAQLPREITSSGIGEALSKVSFDIDFRLGDVTKGIGVNVADFNLTKGGIAATGLAVLLYEQLVPGRQVQF
jgi:hypothetical protein